MRLALSLAGVLAVSLGCNGPQEGAPVTIVDTFAELKPDASPGKSAILAMGTTRNPVDLKAIRTGDTLRIDLIAHREVFETELYRVGKDKFSLVEAASDTFDPPLDLLTFPLVAGPGKPYKGKLTAGLSRDVSATVSTSLDKIFMPAQTEAVRVDVMLSMDSGGTNPARRKLTFWFVKDRGLVQREFGNGLSREPNVEIE